MLCNEELDIIKNILKEQELYYNGYVTYEMIKAGKILVEDLYDETSENIKNVVDNIMAELENKSPYVVVWWYSVLLFINKDDRMLKKIVKYVRDNQYFFSLNTRYFLYCQLKYILYSETAVFSEYARKILKRFFDEIVEDFADNISVQLKEILSEERDNSRTIVISSQFVEGKCKIAQISLDKCKTLIDIMGQNVLLINTADTLSSVGQIPFYNAKYSQSNPEKKEQITLEYEGTQIPYFQCDYPMPTIERLDTILEKILELKPGCIILLGEDNILGALVNRMIPVIDEKILISDINCGIMDNQLTDRYKFLEMFHNNHEQTDYQNIIDGQKNNFYSFAQNVKYKFEDCNLDFYPYEEGKYCVWNKNLGRFEEKIEISTIRRVPSLKVFEQHEFFDITLEFDGKFLKSLNILKQALERKIYVICEDVNDFISYYKIPELRDYMENIIIFRNINEYKQYFHEHTEIYLPRLIFSSNIEMKNKISKIISEEHKYRLTAEGRNIDNILLTIGIPTHNRGNLLLERLDNLLKMDYDSEIEIVVSKNGNILYESEYEEAEKIDDARLCYYGTTEELHAVINWSNVVRFAHGKYVLIVSDEDDVVIDAIEHYLKVLRFNPQLSQIRAKTAVRYAGLVYEYGKKGLDAFSKVFLRQNYLSGLIINRNDFIKANVLQYEKYKDNVFYQSYPHEWWCAALSVIGDCMRDTVVLVEERESVMLQEIDRVADRGICSKKNELLDEDSNLPLYATYEKRFAQFEGHIEFLNLFFGKDVLGIAMGMEIAIEKLAYMLILARGHGYKKDCYSEIIKQFRQITTDKVCSMNFSNEINQELVKVIRSHYDYLVEIGKSYENIDNVF